MTLTLGEAKTKAIQHIESYSNDGTLVTTGENQDYLLLMPTYANDAQRQVGNKIGVDASYEIVQSASNTSGYNKYDLPSNLRRIKTVTLDDEHFNDFRILNGKFVVDKGYAGTFTIYYLKNPTTINSNTADSYIFEVDEHTEDAIPYYIAGMVIKTENPDLSNKLLTVYYDMLGGFKKEKDLHSGKIIDVYGVV